MPLPLVSSQEMNDFYDWRFTVTDSCKNLQVRNLTGKVVASLFELVNRK